LIILAIFLLLGAVVNVAVAWACASCVGGTVESLPSRPRPGTYVPSEEVKAWWAAHAPRRFPNQPTAAHASFGFGAEKVVMWKPHLNRPGLGNSVMRRRTGWPLQAVQGALWTGRDSTYDWAVESPIGLLPLRPMWPGFVLNSLLYATILFVLIPGSFALRRFLRQRKSSA